MGSFSISPYIPQRLVVSLPKYDINIYDKAVIIEAPTHLQVIMTIMKINFSTFSMEKQINRHLKLDKIQNQMMRKSFSR